MAKTQYGYTAFEADIDISSSGDHTLVAASTGQKIRVLNMFLRADDVVVIQFKSGSTNIGGSMRLIDADQIKLNEANYGWFEASEGEALILNTNNATQVSGWMTCRYE